MFEVIVEFVLESYLCQDAGTSVSSPSYYCLEDRSRYVHHVFFSKTALTISCSEYQAFYEEHVFDKQQVHYQPIEVSRSSGILIPGAGPLIPVGKTQDFAIQRKESQGPDVKVRCFTPEGEAPAGGWPALVYFHGGGWVLGNIDTENVGKCALRRSNISELL